MIKQFSFFGAAVAMSAVAMAGDGPTQVADFAAMHQYQEAARIKALAAAGDHAAAVVQKNVDDRATRTVLWTSDDRGATSAIHDYSQTKRTADYHPARIESCLGISSAGVLSMSIELSPVPGANRQFSYMRRFFDSMWFGAPDLVGPVHIEGEPMPTGLSATRRWRFLSRPGITKTGTPYWLGGEADQQRGAAVNRGVFMGMTPTRILAGGDTVEPDAAVIGASASIEAFSVSPLGSQILAVVAVDRGYAGAGEWRVINRNLAAPENSPDNNHTLISQSGTWNGYPVRRFYLPAAGEVPGCNHPQRWAVAADVIDSEDQDSLVIVNNQLAFREGATVGGLVLSGSPMVLKLNLTNDLLMVWGAREPGASVVTLAAFLNGAPILKVNDTVDTDGDGTPEGDKVVTYIAPVAAISEMASADGKLSVYISVHINGVPAIVRLRAPGTPPGGTSDFNGDGDSGTDQDIEAFFACIGGTCCPTCGSADFNADGDVATDGDIEAFFRVLSGGSC
ncbi:MAG TPA: hypothetical protein VD997_09795 [Phycisphaerales bacterium]|nr:hypothetical protein [Phycisphaerales bacterium]